MAFLRNRWCSVAIVAFCWGIAVTLAFTYYYYQYSDLVERVSKAHASIDLGVDYANGTRLWFNGTTGLTLYDAMVNAGWNVSSRSFGISGLYVSAINNVTDSTERSRYWGWWTMTQYGWNGGTTSCDKYITTAGESIIWYYAYNDPSTWVVTPPP